MFHFSGEPQSIKFKKCFPKKEAQCVSSCGLSSIGWTCPLSSPCLHPVFPSPTWTGGFSAQDCRVQRTSVGQKLQFSSCFLHLSFYVLPAMHHLCSPPSSPISHLTPVVDPGNVPQLYCENSPPMRKLASRGISYSSWVPVNVAVNTHISPKARNTLCIDSRNDKAETPQADSRLPQAFTEPLSRSRQCARLWGDSGK